MADLSSVAPASLESPNAPAALSPAAVKAQYALGDDISGRLKDDLATRTTSYDVLQAWTKQSKMLNELRTLVVVALAATSNVTEKQVLYENLILQEARVIGAVVDRLAVLEQGGDADAKADKDSILDRVRDQQDAMRSALAESKNPDAKPLRQKLFGDGEVSTGRGRASKFMIVPSGSTRRRSRSVGPRSSAAAAAAVDSDEDEPESDRPEPGIDTTGSHKRGGVGVEIKSGLISFDD